MVFRMASVLALVWGVSAPAQALDLYVDIESRGGACSDDTLRTSVAEASPWCTLGAAGSNVEPGDTVHVRGGTYSDIMGCRKCNDNAVLQIVVEGRPDAPIRFVGAADEEVVINGAGGATHGVYAGVTYDGSVSPRFVEVERMTIRDLPGNCVAAKDTSDLVFRDLEVTGCGRGAVEFHGTSRATIEYSRIHDNLMDGWTSAVDLYLCRDGNVVRGNRIWGNTDEDPRNSEGHGITMDYCEADGGALIENNVIFGNEGWCMAIYVSDGATIRNNTCVGNGVGREDTGEISILGSRQRVHHNILIPSEGKIGLNLRDANSAFTADLSTMYADYNLIWAPTHDAVMHWPGRWFGTVAQYRAENGRGWGAGAISADPRFLDGTARDYRIGAGSPAIDAGGSADFAELDMLGYPRPLDGDQDGTAQTDMGAYEYAPEGTSPPPDGVPTHPPVDPGGEDPPGGTDPTDPTDPMDPTDPGTPGTPADGGVLGSSPSATPTGSSASMSGGCQVITRAPNRLALYPVLLGLLALLLRRRRPLRLVTEYCSRRLPFLLVGLLLVIGNFACTGQVSPADPNEVTLWKHLSRNKPGRGGRAVDSDAARDLDGGVTEPPPVDSDSGTARDPGPSDAGTTPDPGDGGTSSDPTDAGTDAGTDIPVFDGGRPSTDAGSAPTGRRFYVAPVSSACRPAAPGSGTLENPFTNLYYAATQGGLECGDTLVLRGGVYRNSYGAFSPDGTEADRFRGCDDDRRADGYDGDHTVLPLFFTCAADRPLIIQNYPGEEAILEGSDADLGRGSNWEPCESASRCGPATGLSLENYAETYYSTSFNVSNADTAQMWIDPTPTTAGTRIGWWANQGNLQGSDNAADHDKLGRGRFFSVGSGNPMVARLPDGSDPDLHDVHLTCQIGDCAAAVVAVTEAASHVVVRRNPEGGAFRMRYGYHVIRIDGDAHDLLFDGLDIMGAGGRDYGGCLRTNAGSRIKFTNGTCQDVMGEGIAFYGGGPTNGRQVSGMTVEGSVIRNTGLGWIDGGGLGSSLGMSVILKNCNDCVVRGNTMENTFRDGIWITTSSGGCGSGCTSNGTIVDGNRVSNNCQWSVTYGSAYPPPITGIGDCAAIQFERQGEGSIRGARIVNNMIVGGYASTAVRNASPVGILIDNTIEGVEIFNNSIRDTGGACINLRPSRAAATVRNNALDSCSQGNGGLCNGFPCALMADPSTSHVHSHNSYWGASPSTQVIYLPGSRGYTRDEARSYEVSAVQVAPQFVSSTDLHLSPGSGLVNAGTAMGAPATDADGDSRPLGGAMDIGADEVVGSP